MAVTPVSGQDKGDLYELSPYPSTIVNAGAVPESWVSKRFLRWLQRRGRKQLRTT